MTAAPRFAPSTARQRANWPDFPAIRIEKRGRIAGSTDRFEQAEALAGTTAPHLFPPDAIVEIPTDGAVEPGRERFAGLPSDLASHLGGVDGVATIMARPIGDERDERAP